MARPRRQPSALHQQMIRVHGFHPGVEFQPTKCGACVHLVARQFNKTYYKCAKAGITGGPATDWRKHWDGCGLWKMDVERQERYVAERRAARKAMKESP